MNRAARRAIQNIANSALAVQNRVALDVKPTDALLVEATGSDQQTHVFRVSASSVQPEVIAYMQEAGITTLDHIRVDVIVEVEEV